MLQCRKLQPENGDEPHAAPSKAQSPRGLSTTEFIRSQRLKMAAQLLKTSDINMAEVGYAVGFNDPSYFAKCFKDTFGCSPKQYEQQ